MQRTTLPAMASPRRSVQSQEHTARTQQQISAAMEPAVDSSSLSRLLQLRPTSLFHLATTLSGDQSPSLQAVQACLLRHHRSYQ